MVRITGILEPVPVVTPDPYQDQDQHQLTRTSLVLMLIPDEYLVS